MNVLITNHETKSVSWLKTLIGELLPASWIVSTTTSVESTVHWLKNHAQPGLMFMEVNLPDGKCFEIFDHFSTLSPVIFINNDEADALQAFKYNSVDYLLKPLGRNDVERAVVKWAHRQRIFTGQRQLLTTEHLLELVRPATTNQYRKRFLVKQGQKLIPIKTSEILYFSSQRSMTYLHTRDQRRISVGFSLDLIESMVDPLYFNRVSRNYIISKTAIAGARRLPNRTLRLEMSTPVTGEVTVSRERSSQVTSWLGA